MLFYKLEVKPETEFTNWLTAELIDTYDYVCCDTLEAFQQARRALTINGQIKHSAARHEKYDRAALGDRKHYVLGWSNVEKIEAIRAELLEQQRALEAVNASIKRIEQAQQQEQKREQALQRLLEFASFASIDWRSDEQRASRLLAQKRELEATADHLGELRRQLDEVTRQHRERQLERDRVGATITTLENAISRYEQERSACRMTLHYEQIRRENLPRYRRRFKELLDENEMTFLTLPFSRDAFALFGAGFMIHNLARPSWLADCPIFYWGDLDAQGYQILSRLRSLYPHITSIMMDWETFSTFADFCVVGTPCPVRQLPHLTPEEHDLFVYLVDHNLRLEQERISHNYAVKQLNNILFL